MCFCKIVSDIFVNLASESIREKIKKADPQKIRTVIPALIIGLIVGFVFGRLSYDKPIIDNLFSGSSSSFEETEPTEVLHSSESASLEESMIEQLQNITVGKRFEFGQYSAINDVEKNVSAIEWVVLNRTENEILALSSEGLDATWYHKGSLKTTWEDSDIRSWLKDHFYEESFSDFQKKHIALSTVTAEKVWDCNPGNDTKDYVFLLSESQVSTYIRNNPLLTNEDRINLMLCKPSPSARTNINLTINDGYCWWWLRNTTRNNTTAYYVTADGVTNTNGHLLNQEYGLIRPAIIICLD